MKFSIAEILVWTALCAICFALISAPASTSSAIVLFLLYVSYFFFVAKKKQAYFFLLLALTGLGMIFILIGSEVLLLLGPARTSPLTHAEEAAKESRLFSLAVPMGALVGFNLTLLIWATNSYLTNRNRQKTSQYSQPEA